MDVLFGFVVVAVMATVAADAYAKRKKRLAAKVLAQSEAHWSEPVLAKLGIRQSDAPLVQCPGFSARLEIIRAAPEAPPAPDEDEDDPWVETKHGDLYRVVVTSRKQAFDRVALVSYDHLTPLRIDHDGRSRDTSFTLTCENPAFFAVLVPAVRNPLFALPCLEIRDGCLRFPLVSTMAGILDPRKRETDLCADWNAVLGLLIALEAAPSIFLRLVQMALLDPEPWYRHRAAALCLELCAGYQGALEEHPIWPLKHRRRRLRQLADLDEAFLSAEPNDLFAALQPLLDHPAAEPTLFACDAPSSPQNEETVTRLRAGRVAAADLTPEGWLFAAVLFPEQALASPLVSLLENLEAGAELLLDELFHVLPEAAVDKLWRRLLHNSAYAVWVMRGYVPGIAHRLNYLTDYFYETDDHHCQLRILEFFCDQADVRLGELVRGALPYVLQSVYDADAADTLLVAGLQGLAQVGDLPDLDLLERCRLRCFSDASRAALTACRQAVWARAGIDEAGLVSPAALPDETGALSPVGDGPGALSPVAGSDDSADEAGPTL